METATPQDPPAAHVSSAAWHNARRREILAEFPELRSASKYNSAALFCFALPVLNAALALWVGAHSNLLMALLSAPTLGVWANQGMAALGHEVCHNTVHPSLKPTWLKRLMLISIYSWMPGPERHFWLVVLDSNGTHLRHHAKLGQTDIRKGFDEVDFKAISGTEIRGKRALLGLLSSMFMLSARCAAVFLAFQYANGPIALIVAWLLWVGPRTLTQLRHKTPFATRIDEVLATSACFSVLFFLSGSHWPLVYAYLALSAHFQLSSPLHPVAISWRLQHWGTPQVPRSESQPTFSHYNGWLWDRFFFFQNYHTEHHDFQYLPHSELRRVRKVASRYYDEAVDARVGVLRIIPKYMRDVWAGGGT